MLESGNAGGGDRTAPADPLPSVRLPDGGGAIHGIGEKFSVNPATGTARATLPLPVTPGRDGFGPSLSLSYDSGAGQGVFGLGWSLSVPTVSRKTGKGLPRYREGVESDVFVLAGAEDLVPRVGPDGQRETYERDGHRVDLFRPRVEGLFARIERWTRLADGDLHWRTRSPDNVEAVFGRRATARIADPDDPRRVFEWLVEEIHDDRGNIVLYEYKAEDDVGVDRSQAWEAGRSLSNRHLKRVLYGNQVPFEAGDWHFELVLDYGEHDPQTPSLEEAGPWTVRADPFSTFRAGFDIRTRRLCRRLLMFHRFPELGAEPHLVRSLDLGYLEDPVLTKLRSATAVGYRQTATGYSRKSMPPVELSYTAAEIRTAVDSLEESDLGDLPAGLAGRRRWVDLNGEGLAGVLVEAGGAWFYKRNEGGGRFGAAAVVAAAPSLADLSGGRQQLLDLAGDGRLDLVELEGEAPGLYERRGGSWDTFTPFASLPNIRWTDPNLRFLDLDGDGRSDALVTENEVFRWHRSLGERGFGLAERVPKERDEDRGPTLVFAETTQTAFLADMSGDGMQDLVRIRNGEVCYWPNLGHGRFGRKVSMDTAPTFDRPDAFDPQRLRLADVDGSGTTDLLYLAPDGISYWPNQAGNSWGAPHRLPPLSEGDSVTSLDVVDLLGTGTACLVRSSPLPADAGRQLIYVDLLGGRKPHLLESMSNNMGAEIRLSYAPSTRFYLEDRRAGRPWLTRLPFPVHVVERTETFDRVSGSRLVSTYDYHHGCYDGEEREFRGFGRVDRRDAERLGAGTPSTERDLPPLLTKIWFHTGLFGEAPTVSRGYEEEYWRGDPHPQAAPLPDTVLPADLRPAEAREACRALKGRTLRTEIYALDGPSASPHPHLVTEQAFRVRRLQPRGARQSAVFFVVSEQTVKYHYEQSPNDPRVTHNVALEVDQFGHEVRSAAVTYGRRGAALFPEQSKTWVTCTESDLFHRAGAPGWRRLGLPVESRAYEATVASPAGGRLFTPAELAAALAGLTEIPFEAEPESGTRRLLERSRTLYLKDDLSGPLPLGQAESLALPYESYALALTPGLVARTYGGEVTAGVLAGEGGYVEIDGAWWLPTGRRTFAPEAFYQAVAFRDPFGNTRRVRRDPYALLTVETESSHDPALSSTFAAENDYRVLAPWRVTDPHGDREAVLFDELGLPVARAVMGREGEAEGDTLEDPTRRVEYRFFNWLENGRPCFVRTSARERHRDPASPWRQAVVYSDGYGREVQTKIPAEPAPGSDEPRWVGTGRTVYNNKGLAVRRYPPFFSTTPDFEDEAALVRSGAAAEVRYDPAGRVVGTDFPDGTFDRTELGPWRRVLHDRNDTVLASGWLAEREALPPDDPRRRAAQLARRHADTPTVVHTDSAGRTVATVEDAGAGGLLTTRSRLDAEGQVLAVEDARGRTVATWTYDVLGNRIAESSPDAGERRVLFDVAGNPVRAWRGDTAYRKTYDGLRRLTATFARSPGGPEVMTTQTVYGESHPEASARRLRGRVHVHRDGAGEAVQEAFDFKGNLLRRSRRLAVSYREAPDWSGAPPLEAEVFVFETAYDALDRPVRSTDPAGGVALPRYGESGLLRSMSVQAPGAASPSVLVAAVSYDARGRRERVEYGNGVVSEYAHDPLSERVTRLVTRRPSDNALLQDLNYVHDPVGNLAEVRDAAQQTIYFDNAVVSPDARYEYDPLYRLVVAEGREHVGGDPGAADVWDGQRTAKSHPHDGQAMRRYARTYEYDAVGNLAALAHRAGAESWTRRFRYGAEGNRLTGSSLPGDAEGVFSAVYEHDDRGNMTRMPHLPALRWDHDDRLREVDLGGGGRAYYAYAGGGERVRKVVERPGGLVRERISLGTFELYRERRNGTLTLERSTSHVVDGSGRVALVERKTFDLSTPAGTPQETVRYQMGNNVGSAVLELDAAGAVLSYEEYYPFGATSYQAGPSVAETSRKRYRYTGKERDRETALYYHGARYYAPWLARWTAADPGGLGHGVNPYRYGANNPIRFLDPDGRDICNGNFFCRVGASIVGDDDEGFTPLTAISDNLYRRGEAFANTPDAVGKVWEEEGAVGVAGAFVEGVGHLVKNTGEAGGQMFYVAINESGEEAEYELANSATDFFLGMADITTLVDGVQSGAQGLQNTSKALAQDAKALAKGTKPQTAVAVSPDGTTALVGTGEGTAKLLGPAAKDVTNVAKGTAIMMMESKNVPGAQATPDTPSAGGRPASGGGGRKRTGSAEPSAKNTPWETRYHSADKVPYSVTGPHSALRGTSVYVLKDAQGNVLYVGKGYTLDRLRAHIGDPKKTQWFGEIAEVEVKATGLNNTEALALEQDLIGQLKPMYNKDLNPFATEFGTTLEVGPNLPQAQRPLKFRVNWANRKPANR